MILSWHMGFLVRLTFAKLPGAGGGRELWAIVGWLDQHPDFALEMNVGSNDTFFRRPRRFFRGARNSFLLQRLQTALGNIEVLTSDALGIPTAAKEAIGFAILANETLHMHAGNVPAATGAHRPVVLGKVAYGSNYKRLRGIQ